MAWFDTRLSYNPAVHRVKQAQFHAAIVTDLNTNPLPPAHPELTKYFEPPRRAVKRARGALEECKERFRVREGAYPKGSFYAYSSSASHRSTEARGEGAEGRAQAREG